MDNKYNILAINPGSTSMKMAVYENERLLFRKTYDYTVEQLAPFSGINEQLDFRLNTIHQFLDNNNFDSHLLAAVVGRGGLIVPVHSGAYEVNDLMVDRLINRPIGQHASNLGGILALKIAKPLEIPAYVYDGVTVGEFQPLACLTGLKGFVRQSRGHALNMKAMARRAADTIGKPYEKATIIVAHLGGGITMSVQQNGRMIDMVLDGEGPMTPERSGLIPVYHLADFCLEKDIDFKTLKRLVRGNGGLTALLGTNDAREVEKRIRAGDKKAQLIYETMAYQAAKGIGQLATVVKGKTDCIVLTGSMAYSDMLVNWIKERISFIGPVLVLAGEDELEALAMGALRVLCNEENVHIYDDEADSWTMERAMEQSFAEFCNGRSE